MLLARMVCFSIYFYFFPNNLDAEIFKASVGKPGPRLAPWTGPTKKELLLYREVHRARFTRQRVRSRKEWELRQQRQVVPIIGSYVAGHIAHLSVGLDPVGALQYRQNAAIGSKAQCAGPRRAAARYAQAGREIHIGKLPRKLQQNVGDGIGWAASVLQTGRAQTELRISVTPDG